MERDGDPKYPDKWDSSVKTTEDDKCGFHSSKGTAKFFCKTVTGNLGAWGKSGIWKVGQVYGDPPCRTSPDKLVSTRDKPDWWEDPLKQTKEKPDSRLFSVDYKCCLCGESVNTRVSP